MTSRDREDPFKYWNRWRAKYGSSPSPTQFREGFYFKTGCDNEFWFHWEAAHKSGDWSIFADFEGESDPQEEGEGPRYGEPGFWEDFGNRYSASSEKRGRTASGSHAVLGVRPDATSEEIRSAYRALALKHHPDRGGSVERMREINLAYAAIAG